MTASNGIHSWVALALGVEATPYGDVDTTFSMTDVSQNMVPFLPHLAAQALTGSGLHQGFVGAESARNEVARVLNLYSWPDQKIHGFLSEHPEVADALMEGHAQILKVFGTVNGLRGEVIEDPEDIGLQYLRVTIHTDLPRSEIRERERALSRAWSCEASRRCQGRLVVLTVRDDV